MMRLGKKMEMEKGKVLRIDKDRGLILLTNGIILSLESSSPSPVGLLDINDEIGYEVVKGSLGRRKVKILKMNNLGFEYKEL